MLNTPQQVSDILVYTLKCLVKPSQHLQVVLPKLFIKVLKYLVNPHSNKTGVHNMQHNIL